MTTSKRLPLATLWATLSSLALLACTKPEVTANGSGGVNGADKGGAGGDSGGGGKGGGSGKGGNGGSNAGGNGGKGLDLPDAGMVEASKPKECGESMFMLDRLSAELLLVLDRSTSMRDGATEGVPVPTRWTETTAAIDEVLKATQASIPWGLRMFPKPHSCMVDPMIDVGIGLNNHAMIMGAATTLDASNTGTGTPTAEVMEAAVNDLKARASNNPKYIVLATDGEPTCPATASTDIAGKLANRARGVAAVKAAADAGFKTFVIGIAIGNDPMNMLNRMTLNQMAEAGGFPRAAELKYYAVGTRDETVKALTEIATFFEAKCDFVLEKPAPEPKLVAVSIDGAKVAHDPANGWSFSDDARTKVQLNGAACDKFKGTQAKLKVAFLCVAPD